MQKRSLFILVLLAILVTGYAILYLHILRNFPDIANSFDHRWSEIGMHIAQEGRYAAQGQDGNITSTFRAPPVYPFLYSLAFTIFGIGRTAHEAMRIFQVVLSIVIVYVTYRIGALFNKRAGRSAAVFAALDLSMFYFAMDPEIPDITLGFFAVLSVWCFIRFLKEQHSYKYIGLAGLFLGIAMWTKTSLYLAWIPMLIILGSFLYWNTTISYRAKVGMVSVTLIMVAVFFGGWKLRNYYAVGFFGFSSQSGPAMLWYTAALKAYQDGIWIGEAQTQLKERYLPEEKRQLSEGELDIYLRKEMKKIILASPIDYTITWARGIPGLLLGTFPPYILFSREAKDDIYQMVNETRGHREILGQLWAKGYQGYLFVYGLSKFHLLTIYGFSVVGMVVLLRQRVQLWAVGFMIMMIAYVLVVSSPASHQRYRTPVMPIFYVLGGYGISVMVNQVQIYVRNRRAVQQKESPS